MTTPILHADWRNQNRDSSYPFRDGVEIQTSSGLSLPKQAFLDASFYPVGGQTPVYLSAIAVTAEKATWTVRAGEVVLTGVMDVLNPDALLEFTDPYGRSVGFLLLDPDRIALLRTWGIGVYDFTAEEFAFVDAVCAPLPSSGLQGLLLESGELFSGDVWLVGELGVTVRLVEQSRLPACTDLGSSDAPSRSAIRIDATGDPLFRRRLCDDEALTGEDATLFNTPRFVRRIRFKKDATEFVVTPDQYGGVVMATARLLQAVRGALRINTSGGRIVVELANAG